MKLLLYCTKGKPLFLTYGDCDNGDYATYFEEYVCDNRYYDYEYDDKVIEPKDFLNGKIPCECDYELEDIYYGYEIDDFWTKTCGSQKDIKHNLLKQSCLTDDEMHQYLQPKDSYYGNCGYAIHIKNLHIFNKPKELSDYYHNASKLKKHHKI